MVLSLFADAGLLARSVRRGMALLMLQILPVGWIAAGNGAAALDAQRYHLVTGQVESSAYAASVGISSLIKVRLLPTTGLDLDLIPTSGLLEGFSMLRNGDAQFALIGAVWKDLGTIDSEVRGVATIWRDGDRAIKLLARRDADDEAVYEITKTIFENLEFLSNVDSKLEQTSLDHALDGMSIPLHDGARRYFEQVQALPAELRDPQPEQTPEVKSATASARPEADWSSTATSKGRTFVV
jgi:hypothetical protein